MHRFKRLFLAVLVVVLAVGYKVYTGYTYQVSFSFWNATDEDIAMAFVQDLNGKTLYEEEGFVPISISPGGWLVGSGANFYWPDFHREVLVGWRRPSPLETPAERCWRRKEPGCAQLPGIQSPIMRRDGELIGPFRVDLRSRIPDHEWGLLQRRGLYTELAFGFSVGVNPPQVRWVLTGSEEGTTPFAEDPRITSLSHGGDWGPYKPWGLDGPRIPIPPAPPRGKPP